MILVFSVRETFKPKIQFNGHEYACADEMPVRVRVAYERAVHETPLDPLSIDILDGKVREGQTAYVDVKDGKLEFREK